MTHTEEQNDSRAVAILKPQYLLGVAMLGFALTVLGAFQPRFDIMGYTGLGILGLSVVTWGVIAPEQLRAAITGRTARYGGTAFVVTMVVLVALMAVYVLVRSLDISFDATNREAFSVRPEIRTSLAQIAGNPNTPDLQLVTFLTSGDEGLRDRLTLLFDDIFTTTLGKVSYQFVDIDEQPLLADEYGTTKSKTIAVTPLDENGDLVPSRANIIDPINTATLQAEIVGFITSQSIGGNFGSYFVVEPGGIRVDQTDGNGMSILSENLRTGFGYKNLFQATMSGYRTGDTVTLNAPEVDGETMVIAGGALPLAEEDLLFLQDYLDNGGSLVLMAGFNSDGTPNLATDSALSDYLLESYGIAFNDDFIVDPLQSYQGTDALLPTSINTDHFIGQMGLSQDFEAQFLFTFPTASIQFAETTPDNVTVTSLIPTSTGAYRIANAQIPSVVQSQVTPDADEAIESGSFIIAATAENTDTGSRLVLLGNDSLGVDNLLAVGEQLNFANSELMLRTVIWASHFDAQLQQSSLEQPPLLQRASEQVLVATEEEISTANAILGLALPFGVLALGMLVVFLNREREE